MKTQWHSLPGPIWKLKWRHIFQHVLRVPDSIWDLSALSTETTSVGPLFGKHASSVSFPSLTLAQNTSPPSFIPSHLHSLCFLHSSCNPPIFLTLSSISPSIPRLFVEHSSPSCLGWSLAPPQNMLLPLRSPHLSYLTVSLPGPLPLLHSCTPPFVTSALDFDLRHPGNGISTFSYTVSFTFFCNQPGHCDPLFKPLCGITPYLGSTQRCSFLLENRSTIPTLEGYLGCLAVRFAPQSALSFSPQQQLY